MQIILRNTLSNTSFNDISSFIRSSYDKGFLSFLRPTGQIKEISIVSQKANSDNKLAYHSLVKLEPDIVAERTITLLNKTRFKGRRILLREFINRSWHNDRRKQALSGFDCEMDRRRTERRHNNLETVNRLTY